MKMKSIIIVLGILYMYYHNIVFLQYYTLNIVIRHIEILLRLELIKYNLIYFKVISIFIDQLLVSVEEMY